MAKTGRELVYWAISLSDIESRGNKSFSQTLFPAQKPDLWAWKDTVKAVVLFPRFDVAHIYQQCLATRKSPEMKRLLEFVLGSLGNCGKNTTAIDESKRMPAADKQQG